MSVQPFDERPEMIEARARLARLREEEADLRERLKAAFNDRESRQNADVKAVLAGEPLPTEDSVPTMQRRLEAVVKAVRLVEDDVQKARHKAAQAVLAERRPGYDKIVGKIRAELLKLRALLVEERDYRNETDRLAGTIMQPLLVLGKSAETGIEWIDRFIKDN